MNMAIQTELEKLKELIIKTMQIDKIYLFGSYAYGNPKDKSDIDIHVILPDDIEPNESHCRSHNDLFYKKK